MTTAQNILHSGTLNGTSIDNMSEAVSELMGSIKASTADTVRMRLSVETVMGIWAEELGENTPCQLIAARRLGKTSFILQAEGKAVDPTQYEDILLTSVSNNPNMVVSLGLPAEYCYVNGKNELKLHLPVKKPSPMRQVLFALLAAIALGAALRWVAPDIAASLAAQLLTPLMNTIMRAICMLSGPLVFLSILSGMTGVGDAAAFSKIGGTLTKHFIVATLAVSVLVWLSVSWMFPVSLSGAASGESAFLNLFEMILDIVPKDIISPFQTGNAMQIVFLAVCMGIGGIVLSDAVKETVAFANQLNAIVQLIMVGISSLLPAFIFMSVANLIITSDISELSQILIPLVMIYVLCLLVPLVYGAYASIRTGIPFIRLLKMQYPTFVLAFSTASSAATFSTNVDCCIKDLGMDEKLVRFGVPFGQVLFKLGAVVVYTILTLYMAKQYQIQITPAWILTMIIVVTVLALASPPIPGGALSGVAILFTQLGIPAVAVALSATILTFADYSSTACNVVCLQQELLINAKKLDMLDAKDVKGDGSL